MSLHRASVFPALVFGFLLALPVHAGEGAPPPLPRLVDLGAGKCIPCKKMAPILEELKKDYAGIVDVVFIDVWKDPKAGKPYGIRLIPTQIFFDRSGKEVFRHEGFFSREDIEKVFKEKLGVAPVARKDEEKKEKKESVTLLPWIPDAANTTERTFLILGEPPDRPPLRIQVVYASVACACVMERCQRQGRLLKDLLHPHGDLIAQEWTDRGELPERADSLMMAWGLESLPAVALVDPSGQPYYGDDEELDLCTLRTWLEESP